jgi:hypothetical protein
MPVGGRVARCSMKEQLEPYRFLGVRRLVSNISLGEIPRVITHLRIDDRIEQIPSALIANMDPGASSAHVSAKYLKVWLTLNPALPQYS